MRMSLRQLHRYLEHAVALRAEENLTAVALKGLQYLETDDRREVLEQWQELAGIEPEGPELIRVTFEEFKQEIRHRI